MWAVFNTSQLYGNSYLYLTLSIGIYMVLKYFTPIKTPYFVHILIG